MPFALFVLGHAGSGKTKTSKRWIKQRLKKKEPWALLDKDTVGEVLAPALMVSLGLDPNDRDSPAYREQVRDLEYEACLVLAAEQLKLGINVVLPGPWNRELTSGKLFDAAALGFPEGTQLGHAYLDVSIEAMKRRIEERADPRDAWKIQHWDQYAERLIRPSGLKKRGVVILNSAMSIEDACARLESQFFPPSHK